MENKESPEYQEMASVIAKALKELLPGATVDVKKFSSGSVIVDFRITLPNGEVLSREEVEEKLREAFREGKILDDFEVDANSVQTDGKNFIQTLVGYSVHWLWLQMCKTCVKTSIATEDLVSSLTTPSSACVLSTFGSTKSSRPASTPSKV